MLRPPARILATALLLLAAAPLWAAAARKVVVLGIDGLDPKLLQGFVDQGALPNFQRLMAEGDFKPLRTSMPPLSPTAWSNFITGMNPGGHGIFDFIHRDPKTYFPYSAMAEAGAASRQLEVGCWVIPLGGGGVENLRKGTAFWELFDDHGIPHTIFRMPVNFPPVKSRGKALSGMGTPDIQGSLGEFSFYTDRDPAGYGKVSGGKIYPVRVENHRVAAKLRGPENAFYRCDDSPRRSKSRSRYKHPDLTADFEVFLDPEEAVALLRVQDEEFVLAEGEWSDWVPVRFDAIPYLATVSAVGRFYLKQVRPDFQLYVTPLQIDPADPGGMTISNPSGWSHELREELGYFFTQGLAEDTKALVHGVLDGREFWQQSQFVYQERRKALDHLLDDFEEGFLFFYFSSVDQGSHVLWHWMDPEHPLYEPDDFLKNGIRTLYEEIDEALGRVMEVVGDDATIIVMSDHGFAPFYWQVHLNSWLKENGYLKLKNASHRGKADLLRHADWSRTKAYALGLTSLYVNLKGRERDGPVDEKDYAALLDQLERDLLEMVDPRNGQHPVTLVTRPGRDFKGPELDVGPDLIIGYGWGYRSSWTTPLGGIPEEIFADNEELWSGDHSMDYRLVPGVLLSNRQITLEHPALYDLTVAILDEYGIEKPEQMIGQDCLGPPRPASARSGGP